MRRRALGRHAVTKEPAQTRLSLFARASVSRLQCRQGGLEAGEAHDRVEDQDPPPPPAPVGGRAGACAHLQLGVEGGGLWWPPRLVGDGKVVHPERHGLLQQQLDIAIA